MLKAKIRKKPIDPKLLKYLQKDDNLKAVYAKINAALFKKLKKELYNLGP